MDKIDNDITQRLWPPDSVLLMMHITRQEWNLIAECLINKDEALLNVVAKAVTQRRMDEHTGDLTKVQS